MVKGTRSEPCISENLASCHRRFVGVIAWGDTEIFLAVKIPLLPPPLA